MRSRNSVRRCWPTVRTLAGISPFAEIDEALILAGPRRVHQQLALLENLARRHGRQRLEQWRDHASLDPLVAKVLANAVRIADPAVRAADPAAALVRSIAWLGTAEATVPLLRAVDRGSVDAIAEDHPVDWPAVAAAHATTRFGEAALKSLAPRDDCPEWPLVELARHGGSKAIRERRAPVGLPVLAAAAEYLAARVSAGTVSMSDNGTLLSLFGARVAQALKQGTVTPIELVDQVRPAYLLLRAVSVALGSAGDQVAEVIAGRVAATVGVEPGAWRALWDQLHGNDAWPGTLPDLLDRAVTLAGQTPQWVSPEPFTQAPERTPARQALRDLLDCCPTAIRLGVLPVLDGRSTHDLLDSCAPDKAFVDGIFAIVIRPTTGRCGGASSPGCATPARARCRSARHCVRICCRAGSANRSCR